MRHLTGQDGKAIRISDEKAWTLSEGQGDKTVYIQVKDEAGNITDADDSISYENSENDPPDDQYDYAVRYFRIYK